MSKSSNLAKDSLGVGLLGEFKHRLKDFTSIILNPAFVGGNNGEGECHSAVTTDSCL
jgi:hypothetical protein